MGYIEEQIVEKGGKRYKVLWTAKPPGEQEPVLVEIPQPINRG
jgi:hypothetical protein